ncbi:hypothetical protein TVAG_335920 [Trichomonas vaginalis G3]|uniref:Uncharacterized protein n=1 Tax=Trichomonas vaginalis (strain ATCC PRA-98 / G3) TaxID=412133 RepID=A2FQ95_TRIV3|nr:hypothetical protein TVAGG3_0713790 [Trichomonas vaginalis G3]EAX92930.1 hypothetical protein TVAG_335920 [Trichomonas vaginalis G3]KAI5510111.1 hypothetical protein TVAGG3_0713790 [Trichomonas vaginalis G3]|eukprot:XP_001305860.1 hypothetical protein [Trichomonas vaginalis G3]
MIRKWYLNFYRLDNIGSVPTVATEEAKTKARYLIYTIGYIVDFMSVYHMILSGMALGYAIILQSQKEISLWISYFVRLTQFADYFFYISTFLIFITTFIFAGVLHITNWDPFSKYVLWACSFLLLVNMFSTTYSLPMSLMVTKLNWTNDYWYKTTIALNTIAKELYSIYRPLSIFRMITIVATAPFVAYFTSDCRGASWDALVKLIDQKNAKKT